MSKSVSGARAESTLENARAAASNAEAGKIHGHRPGARPDYVLPLEKISPALVELASS